MSEEAELGKKDWKSKLYFLYRDRLYPGVENLRGFTRVKLLLEEFAKSDLEEISQEPDYIDNLDWKNLVILDGCRHDIYMDVTGVEDSRISAGSMSQDYIERNFSDGDWSDVVYITANPFFASHKFKELTGKEPEEVFHTIFHTYMDKWDDENNTVMPESVAEDAKTAEKLFPEKRKIVHFMQPHHPFVEADLVDVGFADILDEEKTTHEWEMAEEGKISHREVLDAYKQNLEFVMSQAEELLDSISGKTIITADHGNYMGENGFYGHPRNRNEKALRKVPMDVRK